MLQAVSYRFESAQAALPARSDGCGGAENKKPRTMAGLRIEIRAIKNRPKLVFGLSAVSIMALSSLPPPARVA